jgi:SAM-dependent methyltransferase
MSCDPRLIGAWRTIATSRTFQFIHADVFSTHYNPQSTLHATNYRFPFPDAEFDRVYSTSLYTHMLPLDVAAYIGEMTRVLKPGGLMWNSYLLLDEVSSPLASAFNPPFPCLPIRIDNGRIAIEEDPEALTGIDTSFVRDIHRVSGLEISEVRNGPWSGRKDNLTAGYQDVVIASKPWRNCPHDVIRAKKV